MSCELRKFFSKKTLLSISMVLGVNLFLLILYISGTGGMSQVPVREYRAVFRKMQDVGDNEKADYLRAKSEQMDNIMSLEGYQTKEILDRLSEEAEQVSSYETYLSQMVDEMQKKAVLGMLSGDESFAKKNAEKMRQTYESLQGTEVSYEAYEGILLADFTVTNILLVFLIVFLAVGCVVQEKEDGILQILRCCKNGRGSLFTRKVLCVLLASGLLSALFLMENLVVGALAYGVGNLLRPIQSIPDYAVIPMKVSVLGFLVIVWGVRMAALFLIGMFVLMLSVFSYRMLLPLVSVIAVGAVSSILYFSIDTQSPAVLFHYVNPVSMVKTFPLLQGEINLNIFGIPMNPWTVTMAVGLTAGLIFLAVSYVLFVRTREEIHISFRLKRKKKKRYGSFNILGMEGYKLWNLRQGMVILLLAFGLQIASYPNNYLASQREICENGYILQLYGEAGQRQEAWIQDEREKLNVSSDEQEKRLKQYVLEERIVPLYEKLISQKADGQEPRFIQQTGYEKIFGVTNQKVDRKNTLVYVVVMVLVCGLYASMERTSGMRTLIDVTRLGWKKVRNAKRRQVYLFAGVGMVLVWLPDIIWYFRQYGLHEWNARMSWLLEFSGWSSRLSVWMYFLLMCLIRILAGMLLVRLILYISEKCKTGMAALSISTFLFVVPTVLAIMDVPGMDKYTFHALLDGNVVLRAGVGSLGYLLVAIVLYVVCSYEKRGADLY